MNLTGQKVEPAESYGVRLGGQVIPIATFSGPDALKQATDYARRLNYGAMGDGRWDDTWDETERVT